MRRNNPSGGAGMGAGLGAGFAIGNQMMGQMAERHEPAAATAERRAAQPQRRVKCPKCGASNTGAGKFCNECGAKLETAAQTVPCVKCGAQLQAGAKFCNECGAKQEKPKCPNCQAEAAPGAKFCNECGTKIEGEAPPPAA